MMTKLSARECVQSLQSRICPACGSAKKRGHSLCQREYFGLPAPMRDALYCHLGSGYEEAILDALDALKVERAVLPVEPGEGRESCRA